MTVRTKGEAERWLTVRSFHFGGAGLTGGGRVFEVEASRAYRDRLVLKLKGVDEAGAAAELRGAQVEVEWGDAPPLPEGLHDVAELVGMLVVDESDHEIGRVVGVVPAGDADVLRVRAALAGDEEDEKEELLIPLAPDFVRGIDKSSRRIVACVPAELRDLNR